MPTILRQNTSPPAPTPRGELQTLRSRAADGDVLSARYRTRETVTLEPTDSRLEQINDAHSDITLQTDDVEIFRDFAVHDRGPAEGMRRPLQFTQAALQKLGSDFQRGRTMNVHHNGERQVGTTFGAELLENKEVRGVTATWLAVDWYAPTLHASEQRMQDITDMQTGVLRYTSIEFAGGDWQEQQMEMPDGNSEFFFLVDAADENGAFRGQLEAEGIARVALGAVRGAGSDT